MKFILSLLLILLGNCSLAENIQKEELKNYQDTVHNVELVDYEFEERLNSFYESEPINNEDLFELYEGEFPEGERNPQKLRIHWKDARELALAELELQKPIYSSWQNAEISERPILVLDQDGGDFYRYYEYRLIKNNKLLGAIRIPAYRRTENFATAEVHLYSDDEKTYTIHPTGWGQYVASKIRFKTTTSIYQTISNQIYNAISDTVAYNFAYRYIKENEELLPKLDHNQDIFKLQMKKQIAKKYNEDSYIKKLKDQVALDQKWINESYSKFVDQDKIKNFNKIEKNISAQARRIVALNLVKTIKQSYTAIQTEAFSIALLASLQTVFVDMATTPKHNNSIKKSLRNVYWQIFENENFNFFEDFDISAPLESNKIFLEFHYLDSFSDDTMNYLSDEEISKRMMPYIAWRYNKEEFQIYGSLPITKARPGADENIIREDLVSDFNNAIGDIIGIVGQMGVSIVHTKPGLLAKAILDTIIAFAKVIAQISGATLESTGNSALNQWFTNIKNKWENINLGQSEIGEPYQANIDALSDAVHTEMNKIFTVFKETLYGTKDPSTGLYSGGMCDIISIINDMLTSLIDENGNSLKGLSPEDGKNISFLINLCDPNNKEEDIDNILLQIMYTQMAGYGNEWIIPQKPGFVHHLVHLSQSLNWGKKKFYHIDHKYIKPRNLTTSEQNRYPNVTEGGYGAYARVKRSTWKAHASDGW